MAQPCFRYSCKCGIIFLVNYRVMSENPAKRNIAHVDDDDDDRGLKPLRKIRAVSGFNLWHAEFMKTAGTITAKFLHLTNLLDCY